jgi:dTDP-L-rhamnose 4-epimerase
MLKGTFVQILSPLMKKVLITGGAGFIGVNLTNVLLKNNYTVTILDCLSTQIHGENPLENSALYQSIRGKVNFIHGSVTNPNDIANAIADNNIIVHYAAETGTGQSMYEINKYVQTNITGTSLLLEYLSNNKHEVEKVVIASSRALYGEGKYVNDAGQTIYPNTRNTALLEKGIFDPIDEATGKALKVVATDETSRLNPSSLYGITKHTQEEMIMKICPTINIAGVALRYQNVYGPGQSLKNPYTGILSIFSTLIKNNKPLNIFEDGVESRDFVFIDDVVDATLKAIENPNANNEIFNVGTGVATTVLDIAKLLIANYKIEVPLTVTGNFRIGDIRHNFADLTKIQKLLGFVPKINIETGIAAFCNWVNQQEIEASNFEASIAEMKAKGIFK